ncbi:MAG TPA: hypothetical protein VF815_33980 [Myxococcaceae bacterium]|jgi:hypothetical protein
MTPLRAAALTTLLSLCVAPPAAAGEKKSKPSATRKSSEDSGPQWVEKSDIRGFSLKLPQGFTASQDDWSTTYKAVLPPDAAQVKAVIALESLDELNPITNMETAVSFITSKRPAGVKTTLAEQQEIPNGYLVVIGPDYDIYTVHVIRNGKEVQVRAQCSGPRSHLKELKEMCLSVKPAK